MRFFTFYTLQGIDHIDANRRQNALCNRITLQAEALRVILRYRNRDGINLY